MTDTEETLTESGIPIRSQSARFRVSGTGRGRGIVLLYPDKLAAVNSSAQLWGIFLGPIVLITLSHLLFHDIRELGSAVGVLAGGWIGQGIGKRLAVTRVAANRDGVRLVPLDLITSVQFSEVSGDPRLADGPGPARDDRGRRGVRVPRDDGRMAGRYRRRPDRARPRGIRRA